MFLYKIGITGLEEEGEISYIHVLADNATQIEKWVEEKWDDQGACLSYMKFIETMEENILCKIF